MPYTVTIRNNKTGEYRVYYDDGDYIFTTPYGEEDMEHLWTDGNYGCDCNRAILFARANGEEAPDRKCGESDYTICINLDNGEEVYSEFLS